MKPFSFIIKSFNSISTISSISSVYSKPVNETNSSIWVGLYRFLSINFSFSDRLILLSSNLLILELFKNGISLNISLISVNGYAPSFKSKLFPLPN